MQQLPQNDEELKKLRDPLTLYFLGRGLSPAEDLVGEVILRLVVQISRGVEIENLSAYAFGIANIVRLEAYNEPVTVPINPEGGLENNRDDDASPGILEQLIADPVPEEGDEIYLKSLDECLKTLRPGRAGLLIEYYQLDENDNNLIAKRRRIAEKHGLTLNVLYKRIHDLRAKLRKCIEKHLKASGTR